MSIQDAINEPISKNSDLETIQEAIKKSYRGKRKVNVRWINSGDSEPNTRYFMIRPKQRFLAAKGNGIATLCIGLSALYQLFSGKTKSAPCTGWYAQSDKNEYSFIGSVDQVLKWLNIRSKTLYEYVRIINVDSGNSFKRQIRRLEDAGYQLHMIIPGTIWVPTKLVYTIPYEDHPNMQERYLFV